MSAHCPQLYGWSSYPYMPLFSRRTSRLPPSTFKIFWKKYSRAGNYFPGHLQFNIVHGSECKLCPRDWLSHRRKCYWVSKEVKYWKKSFEDCKAKTSQLLVIQDQDEMDFIWNVTKGVNHVWIGLNVTSPERNWMWVDGSLVNQTLFPVTGLAEQNSCGVMKGEQIRSEICGAEFKWVCQKEAFQI
uniref:C-type lectin domain-containing protein n=1 Tax=Chrysemys picta bellii TaxID=8478 RepID=A0A8C3F994_CHRPI